MVLKKLPDHFKCIPTIFKGTKTLRLKLNHVYCPGLLFEDALCAVYAQHGVGNMISRRCLKRVCLEKLSLNPSIIQLQWSCELHGQYKSRFLYQMVSQNVRREHGNCLSSRSSLTSTAVDNLKFKKYTLFPSHVSNVFWATI